MLIIPKYTSTYFLFDSEVGAVSNKHLDETNWTIVRSVQNFGVEAVILVASPVLFSSMRECPGIQARLCKGFALVSFNNKSIFVGYFPTIIKRLHSASRPTSLCFRWDKT